MQKLTDVDTKMRRWQTRLTRATNMLNKLSKQRRRLAIQLGQPVAKADPVIEAKAELVQTVYDRLGEIASPPAITTSDPDLVEKVAAALDIPPFLKRTQADADKMKAERMAKVDKSKMPLTGKAALDAIRPKRKAAAK
jgi:hypothetical protein